MTTAPAERDLRRADTGAPAVPGHQEDALGDPESTARAICLRQLEQRARTRKELADKLALKGIPDDAATAVLDRLTEVGLIDDGALASSFAESLHAYRGLARAEVVRKLRARGVGDDDIQVATAGISSDDEWQAASRLAAKRARTVLGLPADTQMRRLVSALARRGYSANVAYAAAREALAANGHQSEP